jgi:hypothetical protein
MNTTGQYTVHLMPGFMQVPGSRPMVEALVRTELCYHDEHSPTAQYCETRHLVLLAGQAHEIAILIDRGSKEVLLGLAHALPVLPGGETTHPWGLSDAEWQRLKDAFKK